MEYLMNLPIALTGSVIIGLSILGSLLSLTFFHRYVDNEALRKNHDVAGFIYAVITVAYAVILAFVVIVVWENFHDAEKICQEEANAIGDVRRLAREFPDSVFTQVDVATLQYTRGIMTTEWATMARGEEDLRVRGEMIKLWKVFGRYHPTDWHQQQYFGECIQKMEELLDKRRLRLLESRSSLPPIMWVLLLGGGFLSVAFSFLFASPVKWVQLVMTSALAGMFTLVLFLIFALDHPFAGDVRVQPDAFRYMIEHAAQESHETALRDSTTAQLHR